MKLDLLIGRILKIKEKLLIIATAAVLIVIMSVLFAQQSGYPYKDLVPGMLVVIILFCLITVYALKNNFFQGNRHFMAVSLFSVFLSTLLIFLFRSTPFGIYAHYGDAGFNTAMVTKFAYYWKNTDFAYKDLPAFYPSLYQYILGKVAMLLGILPFKMIKYGFIATAFLLPFMSYGLWKRIVGRHGAIFLTFTVFLFSGDFLIYKPYEFISLVLFVPWWLYYVEGLDSGSETRNMNSVYYLKGGALGALIFMSYYYYFFAGIVFMGLSFVADLILKEQGMLERFKERMKILTAAAVLSMPYWLPFLISLMGKETENLQNTYFQEFMAKLPVLLKTVGLEDIIKIAGMIFAAAAAKKYRGPRTVLLMVLAVYGWNFLGHIAILGGFPLLHFKINHLLDVLMPLGLVYGFYYWKKDLPAWNRYANSVLIILTLIIFVGYGQAYSGFSKSKNYKIALNTKPGTVWLDKSKTEKFYGKVFLTDKFIINKYIPVFYFINHAAGYSHPASKYHERIKFLSLLSRSNNPDFIAWMLYYNRFNRVDYVWMKENLIWTLDVSFPYGGIKENKQTIRFIADLEKSKYLQKDLFASGMLAMQTADIQDAKQFDNSQLLIAAYYGDISAKNAADAFLNEKMSEQEAVHLKEKTFSYLRQTKIDDYEKWAKEFPQGVD